LAFIFEAYDIESQENTMIKSEKLVMSFLKLHSRDDLVKEFKNVISMAKSRKDTRNLIESLSIPIFAHIFLYSLFKKNNIQVPKSWKNEIESFFAQINYANSRKNKQWFTSQELIKELNSLINKSTKTIVLKKLESFPNSIQPTIRKQLEKLFATKPPTLQDLGLNLRYVGDTLHVEWTNK
jgi:hypothetical protein